MGMRREEPAAGSCLGRRAGDGGTAMAILIGTSGFSYDDWRGFFYPEDLPKKEMLSYYAEHFPTVEVNATYYSLPSPATFYQMARKVPRDFRFVVKAHKDMTHAEEFLPESFQQFRAALEPLVEAGMLGCVLGQFPWSFKATPQSRSELKRFAAELRDLPVVVEFRNAGWVSDETFTLLRELGLGFCCVDEPRLKGLMPPIISATSPIGYVRFHGRNAAKWWQHEHAYERYDYLYSEEELAEWVPRLQALAQETETTYSFFNNHYEGKAGQNAQMMAQLLNLTLPLAPVG
jgi:uncharacterized protein YecE (DUF72 family)